MGTIANAKVTHYYNCYNGDFIGCLPGFRPFHLIQPLHQRSQRRQPRSLPHLADKALPTDREN